MNNVAEKPEQLTNQPVSFIKKLFNKIWSNSYSYNAKVVYFFLAPLILEFALDLMRYSNVRAFFSNWTPSYFIKLVLTYVLILAFYGLFTALFRNAFIANIVNSVLLYSLGVVSYLRCVFTGDPLLPSDILLAKQAASIASFVQIRISFSMIASFVVVAASLYFHGRIYKRCTEKRKPKLWKRASADVVMLLFFLAATYLFSFNHSFRYELLKATGVNISAFNPISDYYANGVMLTFFPRIGDLYVAQPDNYDFAKINEIKEVYADGGSLTAAGDVKPNVIAIQSEAFWDPTLIESAEFNTDPMPNIRRLSRSYPYGEMVSPVFGGGTCMPEFEFLTGLSTYFLPANSYPFIQHITRETTSIATAFKQSGYETVALHTYKKNFYARNKAYPLMGFDKFIGIEDLEKPEYKGWYVSDAEMTDAIIEQYEQKQQDRMMLFAVSMQNHGGYTPARYEDEGYDIDVQCPGLSDEDLGGLRDFAQGVYDADASFNTLVEYFSEVDEPTIIVMYGDHLPLLGTDLSTYKDAGYAQQGSDEQLFKTPYIVWANYDISGYNIPQQLCAANLGLRVVQMAGLDTEPWYYQTLKEFYNELPVFQSSIIVDKDGNKYTAVPDSMAAAVEDYRLLQYDVLHGKHYADNAAAN